MNPAPDRGVGSGRTGMPVSAYTTTATIDDLAEVRRAVRAAAADAGVATDDLDKLLIAVSEILNNAIRYGGGQGEVVVAAYTAGLLVEISDHGPGLPAGLTMERPAPMAIGGRGLWLARTLCPDLTYASSPQGLTVRMWVPGGR